MGAFTLHEIAAASAEDLDAIGALRLDVWRAETEVDERLFPDGRWIEPLDHRARHWIARDAVGMVGAARLTLHAELKDNPDGYLWLQAGSTVPLPAAHLCKLVVLRRARGRGVGAALDRVRIDAAREMGAKSILVTASENNSRLLLQLGFTDTGIRESFPNRPGFPFRALQYLFSGSER